MANRKEYDRLWAEIASMPDMINTKTRDRLWNPLPTHDELCRRQIWHRTAKMLLFGLVFGAVMFALGVVIGSYGSLRVIEELMK